MGVKQHFEKLGVVNVQGKVHNCVDRKTVSVAVKTREELLSIRIR